MSEALRVLIVEDSEDDALLVLHALREGGFATVHERVDSEPAFLEALGRQTWDLVLSDYAMPRFDGLKAFELHQEHGLDIPFVFVSGRIGEERAVDAMRRGVSDYVQKDNLGRLAAVVHREMRDLAVRRQRREIAEALRASEERLRRLAHNAPDLIFEYAWEPTPHFAFISPAAEVITGHAPETHYNDPELWHRIVHEDDRALLRSLLEPGVEAAPGSTIMRWRHRDGRQLWVEQHTAPVCDSSGHAVGVEGIVRDITERKQLEAQLVSAQRMEAIGRLAGGIAHDFNNMLTVMSGYCSLLRDKLAAHEKALHDVSRIEVAAERSASLVRQLLAFSRRQPRSLVQLDFNRLLVEFVPILRRLIGENIQVDVVDALHLGTILADRGQMEQLLMNLAVNARDAMPDGGRITIATDRVMLPDGSTREWESLTPGPYLRVMVTDTGVGMAPDVLAHLFDPFFTTKDIGTGTGLGLSTVYGIVRQMEGGICVESAPGQGSTFAICLPVHESSRPVAAPATRPTLPGGGERILLVEDEDLVRQATERILGDHGYRVLAAANGPDALELLRGRGVWVDLLLTDLLMPRMTGIELAHRARQMLPGLRVIYVTGYMDTTLLGQDSPAGPDLLLGKPFAARSLLEKVREVLSTEQMAD